MERGGPVSWCGATFPNNRQMRWIEDDGRVTEFRNPSGYSNGNTFDHEGRQLSCEHGGRRVARYEQSGEVTVIADSYEGRPLNSPNDVVVHPDRSIWFTDPPYGVRGDYEGFRAEAELPLSVYRVDGQTGEIARVTDDIGAPNGICFSPDYDRLYVADTGSGREIRVWDVDGTRLRNGRRHVQLTMPGDPDTISGADGMRCDVDGNIWAGARPGVQIVAPDGDTIGVIRLPEVCANVCFGGGEAQPAVHDRQPVALLGVRGGSRRGDRVVAGPRLVSRGRPGPRSGTARRAPSERAPAKLRRGGRPARYARRCRRPFDRC